MITEQFISTSVTPLESLDILSPHEVAKLQDKSNSGLYRLFRQCSLAVLNTGSEMDSASQVLDRFKDFDIHIKHKHKGVQLELINAPATAFVEGELIQGIREHLFTVLRDLLYVGDELDLCCDTDDISERTTNTVFHILRHAAAMKPHVKPNMVVCWGGHSIKRPEYRYTKKVGYELGLRRLNICTGCGPGAMKGPMKGATIAHSKQRVLNPRYVGLTEPGIIAAESPNPIVNELITLPDIEKRLEAFVRLGHGIIVFPGGAGTAEEILYMLGILLHPRNKDIPFPLIFTGPEGSEAYFETVDKFIRETIGESATKRYEIIVDDPHQVAVRMREGLDLVLAHRKQTDESFHYNWQLFIPPEFQLPFEPTHEAMATLNLKRGQEDYILAAQLRRALSGIVAGNVKEPGVEAIRKHGPFELTGDKDIMASLDHLLESFVDQHRMKINHEEYVPCYKVVR
ncbi:nucleotide 5'-monophosphate nucleosidase PpnN [Neptunomonas phycophila]|uniref:nucleotide 5'-monophosphate nucleosidase PpnN n=1 Tax=Neptunomonas phycophila TaxID=1572645 RepID=UPI003BAA69B5